MKTKPSKKGAFQPKSVKAEDAVAASDVPVASPASSDASTAPVVAATDAEQIAMTQDEVARVKAADQVVVAAKLQLADVELSLAEMQDRKAKLVDTIRSSFQDMVKEVRDIAQSHGIDVDGTTDSRKWNLNTADMTFYLVK